MNLISRLNFMYLYIAFIKLFFETILLKVEAALLQEICSENLLTTRCYETKTVFNCKSYFTTGAVFKNDVRSLNCWRKRYSFTLLKQLVTALRMIPFLKLLDYCIDIFFWLLIFEFCYFYIHFTKYLCFFFYWINNCLKSLIVKC